MTVIYTDIEIARLVGEQKLLPTNWASTFRRIAKRGHDERHIIVLGEQENEFHVILRKSQFNPLDFSIILGVRVPQSTRIFRLRRYNGKSHEHTNIIEKQAGNEGQTFYDFHIHYATERYQRHGNREPREDSYAEVTDRYGDPTGALTCLLEDANFGLGGEQVALFPIIPEV